MAKILLAEDDTSLCDALEDVMRLERHNVECVRTGTEAASRIKHYQYDVIVLDWHLPGTSGVDIVREFRCRGGSTPIIMITGKSKIDEKETGFTSGADDYLTKPFHPRELLLRIGALLRRPQVIAKDVLTCQDLSLDCDSHVLKRGNREIRLSPTEFAVLELLMRYPGKTFSAQAIISRLWPNDTDVAPDAVRIYINRLRKSIDPKDGPSLIKTVHGVGYKLEP